MAKYSKKQEVVDAVQWSKIRDHEKIEDIAQKVTKERGDEICNSCGLPMSAHGIRNLDPWHYDMVCPGRWVITREDGRIEYLDDATFQKRYTVVPEVIKP
jgi:hypothetical protein